MITRGRLLDRMRVAVAGSLAAKMVLGEDTNFAMADIKRVRRMAERFVFYYGACGGVFLAARSCCVFMVCVHAVCSWCARVCCGCASVEVWARWACFCDAQTQAARSTARNTSSRLSPNHARPPPLVSALGHSLSRLVTLSTHRHE
jgi:hypothetical protein